MKLKLDIFLLSATSRLQEALVHMEKNQKGTVFVVDNNKRLLGSLTDGDIRRALIKKKPLTCTVKLIMNPDPLVFRGSPTQKEISRLLRQGYVKYVPMLDESGVIQDIIDLSQFFTIPSDEKETKKILVIGGAGYIGSVLSYELLQQGYEVVIFDSMLYGDDSLHEISRHPACHVIVGDIRNMQHLVSSLQDVDAVVHLGEIVGDPACSLDEEYTKSVNMYGTQQVSDVSRAYRVPRFIYASSCSVYGFGKRVFSETSKKHPVSLYGRTKIACEEHILSHTSSYFHPIILRFATVFGWSFRPRFDLAVNAFCLAALQKRPISIYGGEQWRPFVHVKDVVRAIISMISTPIQHVSGEVFNVGADIMNHTLHEIGEEIRSQIPDAQIRNVSSTHDPRSYRVDFGKIRDKCGFQTTYTLRDGIQEMMKEIQKRKSTSRRFAMADNVRILSGRMSEE